MSYHHNPKVSTVVVNWNGLDDTLECLKSLQASAYPNHHVIVVDNGSADGSVEALKGLGDRISLICNPNNVGYSPACNQGIRAAIAAGSDYILLLNNDAVVDSATIAQLVKAMSDEPKAGIAGSLIYYFDRPDVICFAGGTIDWRHGISHHLTAAKSPQPYEVEYVTGAALMLRASMIEKTGIYEDKFFAYFEDTDICVRASAAGWKLLLAPTSMVWHKVSRSTGGHESPLQQYYGTRSRLLFMRRHLSQAKFSAFLVTVFAPAMIRRLLACLLKPDRKRYEGFRSCVYGLRDFAIGYFGEFKIRPARQ